MSTKFAIRDLSVLAYANGFTLWHYKAGPEGSGVATAPNFFADASDMMAPGDLIMVTGGGSGRVVCVVTAFQNEVVVTPLA